MGNSIGDRNLQTWFGPTRLHSWTDAGVTIAVPNQFLRDWLEDHYTEALEKACTTVAGTVMDVEFVTSPEIQAPRAVEKNQSLHAPPLQTHPQTTYSGQQTRRTERPLNEKYAFDNFVVGPSNRFAHAACMAIAESPGRAYNPLFLYGGVGLGKTHLMQAIGNYLLERDPQTRVLYMSGEEFTNELIKAIQHRSTEAFRNKYRSVDVLLVDDIQFIAGKESTQEEFFHTFNALYDAHKQIVMSSDRSPKQIPSLEDRLVSRFEWGLVTDIQPPDIETRIAIMGKKSQAEGIELPPDVIHFIAERITANIRELEGALIRVVAYSTLINREVSIPLVEEVLRDTINNEQRRISVDAIQKKVADHFDIRLSDMKSRKRTRAVAYPRQIAMYLCREMTDFSLPEIGEFFGGKDHTTVMHAYGKIQKEIAATTQVRNLVDRLRNEILKPSL